MHSSTSDGARLDLLGAELLLHPIGKSKREAATALGADAYVATGDGSAFEKLANTFDIVLNTVSAPIDVNAYLGLPRLDGTPASVGVTTEPLQYGAFALMTNGRSIAGSQFDGIRETQEMLDFCAEHDVAAEVEIIDVDRLNEAYRRVLGSDVRYRFVIDNATLA